MPIHNLEYPHLQFGVDLLKALKIRSTRRRKIEELDKIKTQFIILVNPVLNICLLTSIFLISVSLLPVSSIKTNALNKQFECEFVNSNSPIRTNWGKDCDIPGFDESVNGKLQNVVITLRGKITATMKVKSGDSSSRTGTTTTTGTINVNTSEGQTLASIQPAISYTDTFSPCTNNCGDPNSNIPPTFDSVPTTAQKEYPLSDSLKSITVTITDNLNRFTKVGNVKFNAQASAQSTTTIGGNYSLNGLTNASAGISVAYNYNSKPTAENTTKSNSSPSGNVDLSKSLVGKSSDDKINFYTIKTLPDTLVCKLMLKTLSGEIDVNIGQTLDINQLVGLVCKPAPNSEGKKSSFSYTVTDSRNLESLAATVGVNLLTLDTLQIPQVALDTPLIESTVGGSLKTKDCSVNSEFKKSISLDNCLLSIEGTSSEFVVSNIKVSKDSSSLACGYFELNGQKVLDNQKISKIDSDKIIFITTTPSCKYCDIGFSYFGVDKDGNQSKPSKVSVNIANCSPEIEETVGKTNLARTGGYFENNREVIVLLAVLFFSMLFFFSSLSTESIKKVFSKK